MVLIIKPYFKVHGFDLLNHILSLWFGLVKPYFKAYGFDLLNHIKKKKKQASKQASKIMFYKSGLKKSLVLSKYYRSKVFRTCTGKLGHDCIAF